MFSGSAKHHQPHCRNHLALFLKATSQLQLDWGLQCNLREGICLGVEDVPVDACKMLLSSRRLLEDALVTPLPSERAQEVCWQGMTAPPFHLAGPSITHSGHCSRDKSNYVLTHQLLHSSPSAGDKKHPHQPMQQKTPPSPTAHIQECWEDRVPCSAWAGEGSFYQSLGKNRGRKGRQYPSKGWRDRDGDRDGQGVQAMWFCTPPQRARDCPQQPWGQCLCLIRSSGENVTYTELSRGLTMH